MEKTPISLKQFFRSIKIGYNAFINNFNTHLKDANNNSYKFQSLTPINNVNLKVYEDAISFIFSCPDIKNVAISGPYSAGKSSLIESYKKKLPNKKFSHISLSHFISSIEQNDPKEKRLALEGKILNQIIHQISPDRIPRTKFKIKKKVFRKNILVNTFFLLAAVISFLHIRLFDKWNVFVGKLKNEFIHNGLSVTTNINSLLISGPFLILCLGFIIYKIIITQKSRNIFKKVNLQGSEIEIFEEPDDSYFDKYLNEILYLFENIGSDVIVFEDIDRFENSIIFERLREINTLVNIHLKNEKKEPIRFFYLLRDDIFISKDRTKFFDYIVPVIPVIDSSNSYDMLLDLFKTDDNTEKLFDDTFLQGLSLYIDDLRILKNIYNEFVIYYNKLNNIELDCNKMLAIITYKNLFPKDFSKLQLNQGYIHILFEKKPDFIANEITNIKNKISLVESKIHDVHDEYLNSPSELDLVYAPKIQQIEVEIRNTYNSKTKEEKNKSLDAIKEKKAKRLDAIKTKENNQVDTLNNQLIELKVQISELKNKKLNQIITRDNIDYIFKATDKNEIGVEETFSEIKSSEYFELLKYLIRNGYIDETYNDYITYFYENSLNIHDKAFLRSISDKKGKEYEYKLNNPALIVKRLQDYDYTQQETLNFDLLNHLLVTENENCSQLKAFIAQIKNNKNIEFIKEYFDTERNLAKLVTALNTQWADLFKFIVGQQFFTEQQINLYSLYSLYYSNDRILEEVNSDNVLTDYISKNKTYLNIDNPQVSVLISKFKLLNVSFEILTLHESNHELFTEVYANSLYSLSFENIKELISFEFKCSDENKIKHENLSIILANNSCYLAKYVQDNIDTYITVILDNCENNINDSIYTVIYVLNHPEIHEELKKSYANALSYRINILDNITDYSLWRYLLENKKVEYTSYNIFSYFSKTEELDETLVNFIDSEQNVSLDFSVDSIPVEIKEKLFHKIIGCSHLTDDKYHEVLSSLQSSLELVYNSFDITELQDNKTKSLIELAIINMTSDNLLFLRAQYETMVMYFIHKNIEKYIEIQSTDLINKDEILGLFNIGIDDILKEKLSNIIGNPISIQNDNYSNSFKTYILMNHLDVNDIPYIIEYYDRLISLQKKFSLC